MRKFESPPLVRDSALAGLADLVYDNAAEAPGAPLFSVRSGKAWRNITAQQFRRDVTAAAQGLLAMGVGAGDRVVLICRTRYEWALVGFASWAVRAILVPVAPDDSAAQVRWILGDCQPSAVIMDDARHLSAIQAHRAQQPGLGYVWQLDGGGLQAITQLGAYIGAERLARRIKEASREDIAALAYVSTTGGQPKGCALTHGNFLSGAENTVELLERLFFSGSRPSTLMSLPLARVSGYSALVSCLTARVRVGFPSAGADLAADLALFEPTLLFAVPRTLERIYEEVGRAEGGGAAFDKAARAAASYAQAETPGWRLRRLQRKYDQEVYSRLRAAMGGRMRALLIVGAPLPSRLGHLFGAAGIDVLQGYALPETAGAVTMATPEVARLGALGRPVPGNTVAVANSGELFVSGRQVFSGYWNDAPATTAAFVEGWFGTGDLARIERDGQLAIVGRSRELLLTSEGARVAPAALEEQLRRYPLIGQAMVVGERRPFVGALLALDPDQFDRFKLIRSKPVAATAADLANDLDLLADLRAAVDAANEWLPAEARIRVFDVVPGGFTEDNGYLTGTLRLRRKAIINDFRGMIDAMYARQQAADRR